ncbi:NADP-dependent oxidoreductase domain-containing protein [Diplogelasinospora grovesii]|uniref:NADP-dependent oxidoreductase domain-containing protein n=1 Tax=Diplogelasinospora grovesii TaxID=303347 RepID=A0AAN6NHD8_9PEZI|nr:NADP-dependent oxidoreductase domain-containing protein [Diplogelasinospora grovesii]
MFRNTFRQLSSGVRSYSKMAKNNPKNIPSLRLASGHVRPLVGYGIWKVPRSTCADSVYNAIKLGYRHIDGAHDYQNSTEAGQGVRRAISDGLVKREDLFITSKLWNNYHRYENAIAAAKRENDAWGLDYLDLFLIHFPCAQQYVPPEVLEYPCFWTDATQKHVAPLEKVPNSETWAALETLVKSEENPGGILKSIGVANFSNQLLYEVLAAAKVPVSVLQIEHHPYLVQDSLVKMAQEEGVVVTAYSSFGPQSFIELGNEDAKGVQALFENEVIKGIAAKHGKTPAQVLLRWATQRNIVVIPKSNSAERLAQNLDSVGFDMSNEDLDAISGLDRGLRFNNPGNFSNLRIF